MATLPIADKRFDRLYSRMTGLARKNIDKVRHRRAHVVKHHLTEEGIFGTKRECRGRVIPWEMKKKALNSGCSKQLQGTEAKGRKRRF